LLKYKCYKYIYISILIPFILSRQIQILNRTTCSNFTNEDWRYFLYNLLYYKQNINLFLPEHYANIADVLLVWIQLNLIKNSYILNINIHKLKNIKKLKNIGGMMIYTMMLCARSKKTRHQSVSRAHCGNYSMVKNRWAICRRWPKIAAHFFLSCHFRIEEQKYRLSENILAVYYQICLWNSW
jgi:hypothetical protein